MTPKMTQLLLGSIALSSTAYSSVSNADVVIEIPYDVTILAANEQHAKLEGNFFSETKKLTLPNGENQIVFEFEPSFKDRKERRQYVTSDAYIATFTAVDETIVFELPEFRDINEAEIKISNLSWDITTKNGKALPLKADRLQINGVQVGLDYPREIEDYNQYRTGPAAWFNPNKVTQTTQIPAPTTPVTTTSTAASQPLAKEMLHFWYAKADEKTKQEFKAYLLNL